MAEYGVERVRLGKLNGVPAEIHEDQGKRYVYCDGSLCTHRKPDCSDTVQISSLGVTICKGLIDSPDLYAQVIIKIFQSNPHSICESIEVVENRGDLRRIAIALKSRTAGLALPDESSEKLSISLTVKTVNNRKYFYENYWAHGKTHGKCLGRTLPIDYDLSIVSISKTAKKYLDELQQDPDQKIKQIKIVKPARKKATKAVRLAIIK